MCHEGNEEGAGIWGIRFVPPAAPPVAAEGGEGAIPFITALLALSLTLVALTIKRSSSCTCTKPALDSEPPPLRLTAAAV